MYLEVFYANFYTTVMVCGRRIGGASSHIKEEEKIDNNDISTAYDIEANLGNLCTNESKLMDKNNQQLSKTVLQK